jgi:hypothetical protein
LNFDQTNCSEFFANSPLKKMKLGSIGFNFGVEISEYNWKQKVMEKTEEKRSGGRERGERSGALEFWSGLGFDHV